MLSCSLDTRYLSGVRDALAFVLYSHSLASTHVRFVTLYRMALSLIFLLSHFVILSHFVELSHFVILSHFLGP